MAGKGAGKPDEDRPDIGILYRELTRSSRGEGGRCIGQERHGWVT